MPNDITIEDVKRGTDRLNGRMAVIVGASSGIGAETARELASRGTNVVITARNRDGLEKVAASARDSGRAPSSRSLPIRRVPMTSRRRCASRWSGSDVWTTR